MKVKDLIEMLKSLNQDANIKTLTINDYGETFITNNLEIVEYQDGYYILDGRRK